MILEVSLEDELNTAQEIPSENSQPVFRYFLGLPPKIPSIAPSRISFRVSSQISSGFFLGVFTVISMENTSIFFLEFFPKWF